MFKSYQDLIFKIIIIIIFTCVFIHISNSNKSSIELGDTQLNSLVWISTIVSAILIFSYYDNFLGTLLFILLLLHYKKFFKDPFSLHEHFSLIEELFTNQQNKNLKEYDYAPYPTEIKYSLDKYPIPIKLDE
jgi:hypothetical protein